MVVVPRDCGRRDVERGHREAAPRELLGVVTEPAADLQGPAAGACDALAIEPGNEARIRREIGPRDGARIAVGLGVEDLEPADGVPTREMLRGERAGAAPGLAHRGTAPSGRRIALL